MKKNVYMMPLVEVAKVNMSGAVLTGSPIVPPEGPVPPQGPSGAPKHDTPAF